MNLDRPYVKRLGSNWLWHDLATGTFGWTLTHAQAIEELCNYLKTTTRKPTYRLSMFTWNSDIPVLVREPYPTYDHADIHGKNCVDFFKVADYYVIREIV